MEEKTEGTLVLDGMLEGKLPDDPEAESRLHEWIGFAASLGLPFQIEIDGDSFSILADDTPVETEGLGDAPADKIVAALDQLLKVFPADSRRRVFSTVRSIHYLRGEEVQTLYTVGTDGAIQTRQRTVDARTKAPPRKLTGREKRRIVLTGVAVAAVLIAISALFVPYGELFGRAVRALRPFDLGSIEVRLGRFGRYFTIEKMEVSKDGRAIVFTLERTSLFPRDEAALTALMAEAGDSVPERLTVEALARGYVRCEYFDREGEFITFTFRRVSDLRVSEQAEVHVPLPAPRNRLGRIQVTY